MNSKTARRLRFVAKQAALVPNKTTNENVQVKSVKSGRMVMNDSAAMVEEEVPVVTFTTKYVDDCPRKLYKELKKEQANA